MFGRVVREHSSVLSKQTMAPRAALVSRCMSSVSAEEAVSMEVREDGVAVLTMNFPPVNALHPTLVAGLKQRLSQANEDGAVKAVVLTGANNNFVAGADIKYMNSLDAKAFGEYIWNGNEFTTELLERSSKPSVAAVDGVALGGGCELAMACNGRVATAGTKFGLPELSLGIIPGMGGTQRLPRLIGIQRSLELMLTSASVNAEQAHKMGLVDRLSERDGLVDDAAALALDMANGTVAKKEALNEPFPDAEHAEMIFEGARAKVNKKRPPNSEFLDACIDAVEAGLSRTGMDGLRAEYESFMDICQGKGAKALLHVFVASKATGKVKGVTDQGLTPTKIQTTSVIGGGLMGSGIATALVMNGYKVNLLEVDGKAVERAEKRVQANLQSRVKKGRMTEEKFSRCMDLLQPTVAYDDLADSQLVIEAVVESVALKQDIFSKLESVCAPEAILASNTSTIDLNIVSEQVSDKSRVVGAHFFSPAHVMPLLEIVRTEHTSKQVLVDMLSVAKGIRKTPVVVGNCVGFMVNRMFFPFGQAAGLLVNSGLDPYRIDQVVSSFGFPMGPFRLSDMVGIDVTNFVNGIMQQGYGDRTYVSALPGMLVDAGRMGEKTDGKGFYSVDSQRKAKQDPELNKFLVQSRNASGLEQTLKDSSSTSDADILEMIMFPIVNEATRVLNENMAQSAADIDVASIMGMGFPATRGGLLHWAASDYEPGYIAARLNEFADRFPSQRAFFEPTEGL